MKTTTIESVNAELGSFVSLASDPTALPTFTGLQARQSVSARIGSTLIVVGMMVAATWARAGQ